jgi:hypothetical protein
MGTEDCGECTGKGRSLKLQKSFRQVLCLQGLWKNVQESLQLNTLRTGGADLRLYITTVQDE